MALPSIYGCKEASLFFCLFPPCSVIHLQVGTRYLLHVLLKASPYPSHVTKVHYISLHNSIQEGHTSLPVLAQVDSCSEEHNNLHKIKKGVKSNIAC